MARRRRTRGPKWRSPRIWIAVVAVLVVGVLYYKPAQTYLHTRDSLSQRSAEVQKLRAEHAKSERARADPELASSLKRATAEQRRLRPELPVGIGGASRDGSLKCLHAHAAFALARPGYELGDRILAELPSFWPSDRCCSV